MGLPFFYIESIDPESPSIFLNEETSKHIVQVLRMQNDEQLQLTDGKGNLFTAEITDNDRKNCTVAIVQTSHLLPPTHNITIAVSLIKNSSRFEWFLEKATEIGVTTILPLICVRTEKQHFRYERMKNILVSAMLQSRQCWLPVLFEPVAFEEIWQSFESETLAKFQTLPKLGAYQQKFIAHCLDEDKGELTEMINGDLSTKIILIGPEGDFTKEEVGMAIRHHFIPVALGKTRLRTETAGVVAASLLCLV